MQCLRAAAILRRGGLIAHATSTLPGIAASPRHAAAIRRLQAFKRRRGPFLMLADTRRSAWRLARRPDAMLRRESRRHWPGKTTLVFAAKPGLPAACLHRGEVAVRVDASAEARLLARACGGLLLSSSLNRSGQAPAYPDRALQLRWRRWLSGRLVPAAGKMADTPSRIVRIRRNICTAIRQ